MPVVAASKAKTTAVSSTATSTVVPVPVASLKRGASGTAVRQLQTALKKVGQDPGPVDGVFGAKTEAALKRYQSKMKLVVDGLYGPQTRAALTRSLKKPAAAPAPASVKAPATNLKRGSMGTAVRQLQTALKKVGFNPGPADGIYGAKTEAALKSFQSKYKLVVDGQYGPQSRAALTKALAGQKPPTTKPPTTTPTKPPSTGGVKAPSVNLKPGANGTAVKQLQTALKKVGFNPGPIDGDFGSMTKTALMNFQARWNITVDGTYGPQTRATLTKALTGAKPPALPGGAEPAHNYTRVRYGGGLMNVRTRTMLQNAEKYAKAMGVPVPVIITQGSYSTSVAASAGTHDKGGALDIRTRHLSRANVEKLVKALRMAGFAGWKRGYGDDSFSPHIHAIAIGDRELTSSARNQVREYFAGGDGLVGSRADGDRGVGRPYPAWAKKYR